MVGASSGCRSNSVSRRAGRADRPGRREFRLEGDRRPSVHWWPFQHWAGRRGSLHHHGSFGSRPSLSTQAHDGSALQPTAVRTPPNVRSEPYFGHAKARLRMAESSQEPTLSANGIHAFSSRLSSFRKRQSVPSAMIVLGFDRIMPTSYSRSAKNRSVSAGSYSRHLPYGRSIRVCKAYS